MREYFPVNNKDCDSANSGSISDVIKKVDIKSKKIYVKLMEGVI